MLSIDLAGKRALVTGGSRGIGRAVAERLAAAGARVAVNYLRRTSAAEEVVRAIEDAGGTCMLVRGNVYEAADVERVVGDVVTAWGGVDIVVSNAATGVLRPVVELTRKHVQVTFDTNALALVELARNAVPHMPAGGSIIAMSSMGSVRAVPQYAAVGASKAALEAFVRQLASELGTRHITVNAISAGVVETEALDFFPSKDLIIETTRFKTPNHELVTPADVADVAVFLASPLARSITGQTIVVDNGYSIVA